MEFEEDIFLVLFHKTLDKKKTKHKFCARQERFKFYTVINDVSNDEWKSFNHFRMSVGPFDELLQNVRDYIAGSNAYARCDSPEELHAVTFQ
jgi:hypothetical protein